MNSLNRMQDVVSKLRQTSFTTMPAFEHPNLKRQGGLLLHSLNLWMQLEELTTKLDLEWSDPTSPFVIAMLHHACNIGQYLYNPDYQCWEANRTKPGHGVRSLQVAEELGIELTDEEKACILYHHGDRNVVDTYLGYTYAEAAIQHPNILWVHTADLLLEKKYGTTPVEVDYAG